MFRVSKRSVEIGRATAVKPLMKAMAADLLSQPPESLGKGTKVIDKDLINSGRIEQVDQRRLFQGQAWLRKRAHLEGWLMLDDVSMVIRKLVVPVPPSWTVAVSTTAFGPSSRNLISGPTSAVFVTLSPSPSVTVTDTWTFFRPLVGSS